MGTSAKRLGLEVDGDLELELRLRRIEVELEKRVLSNTDAVATSRSRLAPPAVTGLVVKGQTPGTVTMGWNPSTLSDLNRYQIQFAEDAGFSVNKQTFNTRDIMYQFSTASASGGTSGTVFYTRVRAQNSIGVYGSYSSVVNTATGQVVGGDIADESVDTEEVADDAITADKIDIPDLISVLTLPGPGFSAGDANKYVRVNSIASAYETVAGTLPDLAAAGDTGKLIRVAGSNNLDYTSYTFPSTASVGKLLRGDGTNWIQTGFTFPSTASSGKLLRGDGLNWAETGFTFPSTATTGKLLRGDGTNWLETGFTFPSAATDDNVLIGDGTNFVAFDQSITDALATDSGAGALNRSGQMAIAPGLTLTWDTIEVADSTNVDVTGLTDQVVSVFACAAAITVASSLTPGVAAWVLSDTSIRLHQDNTDVEAVDVTYFVLSNTLIP